VRLELKRAYRMFFLSDLNVSQAIARARQELDLLPEVERFIAFFESTERGVSL
jgi:UDP-N-acetylglucosamine acyltransferase